MNQALIAGATGVVGRYLLRHLNSLPGWSVVALSRRAPDVSGGHVHVAADLLDPEDCRRRLAGHPGITHVFYTAYADRPTQPELVATNLAMLRNVVEAVEPVAAGLAHINLVEGTKWYGSHLGPFRTPAREADPRHMPPNFYYDQQDFIAARQRGKQWTWSAIRPHAICGFSLGSPMNLVTLIAVYAAISRELGLPLCHPGRPDNPRRLYQVTGAGLAARAMTWMATEPRCANEAFNITNGDLFRWENLWPRIARFFDMEVGTPRHISLQQFMSDKGPVWEGIVARHGLVPHRFEDLAAWKFGDFVFSAEWDIISDMGKARRAGWNEAVDSEEMFLELFAGLRRDRIIP